MIQALVFDAYGTLLDTKNGSVEAVRAILAKNKCNYDAHEFYEKCKAFHRQNIEALTGFLLEEELFLLDLTQLYAHYGIGGDPSEDVQILLATLGIRESYPEVVDTLNTLGKKYKLFIGSTSDNYPLQADLTRNNIVVDDCFTAESLRVYKGRKEFYEIVLADIGLDADEVMWIGDSLTDDVFGPKSVGMPTVWLNRKNRHLDGCTVSPDYQISDLSGLLAFL